MGHVLDRASSGRARCRACREPIPKDTLRLGQREPNPFGDGEATYYFHPRCGAAAVPTVFLTALAEHGEPLPAAEPFRRLAELAAAHRRLARIGRVERSPTGRARCRQCHDLIAQDDLRISLRVIEEGMIDPRGFIHARCSRAYFEGDVLPLLEARGDALPAGFVEAVGGEVPTSSPTPARPVSPG